MVEQSLLPIPKRKFSLQIHCFPLCNQLNSANYYTEKYITLLHNVIMWNVTLQIIYVLQHLKAVDEVLTYTKLLNTAL